MARIIVISGNGGSTIDGVGHYTTELVRTLARLRPAWRWLHLYRKPRWFQSPIRFHGSVVDLTPWHSWSPLGIRLSAAATRSVVPDLIHIQEEAYSYHMTAAVRRLGGLLPGRTVTTLHEVHTAAPNWNSTKSLIADSVAVLTNDRLTGERCSAATGRRPDEVLWSPANVFPDPAQPPLKRVPNLVVTFGFLNGIKNLHPMAEALKRIRTRIPDLKWRIVGPFDPTKNTGDRELASLFSETWIEFTGARADPADPLLRRWIGEADVMALPFSDGASVRRGTLQTAWAFGLPVVTTRSTTPDAAIADGDTAVLVDVLSVDGWTDAIHRILTDCSHRERLAAGSRAAFANFSWERLAGHHLELYDRLIGR